jgi:hypothetical protein
MLQMILPLTRSSRLCTFQLLGLEMSSPVTKKKNTSTQRPGLRPLEDKIYLLNEYYLFQRVMK